ncbi:MAG TPA: DNA repair protein RadA, partial [Acidimicrobiales bacterium]
MSRNRCTECGTTHPKWAGRCPSCGAWNTLVEQAASGLGLAAAVPRPITEIAAADARPVSSGLPELDRVLGGGLVPGSVTVVGGEPGIGKSTLLLQVAAARAHAGAPVLYVSGEESGAQVRDRAGRLGAMEPALWLLSETQVGAVVSAMGTLSPALVVVDSIQTLVDPDVASSPGSVTQVRDTAHRLVQEAKQRDVAVVLIGHVTKDGALAGPRVLEHVVDTVLSFEGDRHHALRLLRAVKHRYGPTSELGLFEMAESGLTGVADASRLFLSDRVMGIPGSVVVPTLEGHRPLLVEVQALVVPSPLPTPRRSAQGFDQGRLALLVAVLSNRVGLPFVDRDVYASVVGGVRLGEPGSDLGICLALASALTSTAVPGDLIACGEVGLGGELRQVAQTPRRLAEAARLGFRRAIVPASAPEAPGDLELVRVTSVAEAVCAAGLSGTGADYSAMRATGPRPAGRGVEAVSV